MPKSFCQNGLLCSISTPEISSFPAIFRQKDCGFFRDLKKSSKPMPISLGMLELTAKMQQWDTKFLEDAYSSNNYQEPSMMSRLWPIMADYGRLWPIMADLR